MNINKLVPGAEHSTEGWMWATDYGSTTFVEGDVDMTSCGYFKLFPAKVEFVVPQDFSMVGAQVSAVDAKMEQTTDAYHRAMAALREQKENLLALPAPENKPDADNDFPF